MLEYTLSGIFSIFLSMKHNIIFALIVIDAGSDLFIILANIDFFISDAFGSSANKNEGTPTVNVFIIINWRGLNGSAILKKIDIIINIAEYIVLTKNKLEEV